MKMTRRSFLFGLGMVIVGGIFLLWRSSGFSGDTEEVVPPRVSQEAVVIEESETTEVIAPVVEQPAPMVLPQSSLIAHVPFTVQAPFAEWADPIFQDACEEASVVMAAAWVSDTTLTKELAKRDITALAKHQKQLYGHSVDTSIGDTEKLLRDFLQVTTTEVKRGVTVSDIKEALAADRIVIVPTDGRKLGNPNFKQPGPPRHMLVVIGYDDTTKEFIVNDPGTRKGEGYRYDQSVLYDAMLDYPTGKHAEAKSADKVMLTVWQD